MKKVLKNQFFVIRHGNAKNNELDIISCKLKTQKQYGLTKLGKEIVFKEAQEYINFDLIYCSPFRRTQETAEFFANTSNCNVILDIRLKEFDSGNLDLKSPKMFTSLMKKIEDHNYVYENGESFSDVIKRLIDFIDEINSKYNNKQILIVTHGIPAEVLIDLVKNIPLRKWEKCIEKGKVFLLK